MTETKLLDGHGAAAYLTKRGLQVVPESLARWARSGRYGLAYIKVGRILRYDPVDLDTFIDKHRVTSEGD